MEQLDKVRQQRSIVRQHQDRTRDMMEDFLSDHEDSDDNYRTLLRRPTSWKELERTVLDPQFAKAVRQSWKRQRQLRQRNKLIDQPHEVGDHSGLPPLPWVSSSAIDSLQSPSASSSPDDYPSTLSPQKEEIVLDAAQLEPLIEQEAPDGYSLPVLQPAFCARILALLRDVATYRQSY